MNRLLELSVLDGLIRYMRELRDHHTHDDTRNSPMTATGTARVSAASRGGTGKNRKRSGDDTSELHVWCPAAPIATNPMEISSRDAPKITPCLTSPNTRTASVLSDQWSADVLTSDQSESMTPTIPTKPSNASL